MKSLPSPPKRGGNVLAGDDEVAGRTAEIRFEAVAALDDVVAVVALEDIVAAHVGDDVVAGAAHDVVDAVATLEPVVAGIAVERVVADAGDEDVVAGRAAEDDMVVAGVLQVVRVRARGTGVVANDQRGENRPAGRVVVAVGAEAGELPALVDLEDVGPAWRTRRPGGASRRY